MSITAITPQGHAIYHAGLSVPRYYDDCICLYKDAADVKNGWTARYPLGTVMVLGHAAVVPQQAAVDLILAQAEARTIDKGIARKLKRFLRGFNSRTWSWR